MKLDAKDHRLLYHLDTNARMSFRDLGKACRMPLETARYRVQRMIDNKVVLGFLTSVDGGRLGYYHCQLFFSFHRVDARKMSAITKFILGDDRVVWVLTCEGNFDLGISFRTRSPFEVNEFLEQVRTRFGTYINRCSTTVNIKKYSLGRKHLLTRAGKKSNPSITYSAEPRTSKCDRLDVDILNILSQDTRSSASAIARQLDSSADTVALRIKKLERAQVITEYSLVLNTTALDLENYYTLVYMQEREEGDEEKLLAFCSASPQINYVIKSFGEWDYEINTECKTYEEYHAVMMGLTSEFSGRIRDYQSLRARGIERFSYAAPLAVSQ